MKIGVLTRNPKGYSMTRLREAAQARGHSVRFLDTKMFSIQVEKQHPGLWYKGKDLPMYDAIVPRIGASLTFFGTAVLRQFEQMGVFALNTSQSIIVSRDKLRSLQVLSRHDIGITASTFVRNKEDVMPAIQQVGGAPVIIKLLEGTQGVGVILADSANIAAAIIETLQGTKQNVLIQKFVAESKGKDVRAFVVGDRVVAAMRRRAQGAEFRSNVHRGGMTEKVQLDPAFEQTAVRAAQIMGLRVAGVDMLESKEGPQVMEVNSSPGLEGIEEATGADIAGQIVQLIEDRVMLPDIDLRQRLTIKSGYGVAEFHITKNSSLANTTIANSRLRDQEILVLSIQRGSVIIPSPKGSQEILPGDHLICFGKNITLKSLVPTKRPKRRKKKKSKPAN
ncbi:MAG: RimK family alpha-L-glutamate ligase [Phycisphaeraceae bacterium]|nr:RimK family alpha-L-glutamate ligase [Phycisphaeraceae bacterium]